jgi:hypothetical protein
MPNFAAGYIEPGTYVKIQDIQLAALPPGAFVGAIIGTGISYKLYSNEQVIPVATAGQLAHYPVVSGAGIPAVSVLKYTAGGVETAAAPGDYTLNATTGAITAIDSGIEYLSFTYPIAKTAADYEPLLFSDLNTVYAVYGEPDPDGTGGIVNKISAGADIFFSNGGGLLACVQTLGDTQTDYQAGLDRLRNSDVYCIVPLLETNATINPAFKTYVATHVNTMSSTTERRERIALLGGPVDADDKTDIEASVTAYMSFIDAINEARIGYVVPSSASLGVSSITYPVGGPYIACAIAGIMCNPTYTSGEPISGKTVARISELGDIYTRYQKNRMAGVGGLVVENNNGTYRVRHALSTNTATAITSELKITKIKDYIAKTMRNSLDATYINTRNVGAETVQSIKASVRLLLEGVISIRDIVSYENITVAQDPTEPRQINVSFQIRPTWDINWILCSFGVTI